MEISECSNLISEIEGNIINSDGKENAYLLTGTFDSKSEGISIIECMNLNEYIEESTEDKLSINKKFIYASIKEFLKNNWVYILMHTHPFQTKDTLKFSCIDDTFYESLNKVATEIGYDLPLVFGISCKEVTKFKIYFQNKTISSDNLTMNFNKLDFKLFNIEILLDDLYYEAIIYHKNTNSMKIVSRNDAAKIQKWKAMFEEGTLSKSQETTFKQFIYSYFNFNDKMELLSNRNFVETGIISDLRFMVQLGCNLRCKYCYADEGTYGFEKNIILNEINAIKIINNLIVKGIKKIKHISFLVENLVYIQKCTSSM